MYKTWTDSNRLAVLLAGLWLTPEASAQGSRPAKEAPAAVASREALAESAPPAAVAGRNFFGLPAAELEEPIVTDRPDFTESTLAVPAGHIQVESGYTFTFDREHRDRSRDHTAPEFLYRIGLWEEFELRISWLGYSWREDQFETRTRHGRRVSREAWTQGANDLGMGFKQHVWDQSGWRPDLGVIVETSVPSGSGDLTSGDVDPGVKLLWAYDLTDAWSLAGNLNAAVPTERTHRFFQISNSVSLAAAWTDRLGTYCEYFGFYPHARHGDCAHYLNGGFTILLTPDVQLDFRAGVGLNEEADDFFAGAGLSFRL